jgi:hypothetical protein
MKTVFTMKTMLFLVGFIFANASRSHGQLSDSLKNELKKVSAELYAQKNNNFMIVDAILDNQIRLGVHYEFRCDSVVTINNKRLAPVLEKKYLDKLKQNQAPNNKTTGYKMEGTATLKELFDPTSFFRMSIDRTPDFLIQKQLIPLLTEDLLLDTTTSYAVYYDIGGLYINNARLSNETAAKYIQLIHSLGFYARSKGDNLQFSGFKTH